MRKERASLAAEIIGEIRRQIPEFARPLAGQFGAGIQQGVETALEEFADLVEGGGAGATGRTLDEERLRIYRALGRGELTEGRSLDALQAAYRLGARVAWRRYARIARRTGMGADRMVVLAEAIFAHIDEIASASVLGYADAKADQAGTLGRRRDLLLGLLLSGAGAAAVEQAAAAADWPVPATVACVALGAAPPTGPGGLSGAGGPSGSGGTGVPGRSGASGGAPRGRRSRLPDLVLADLDGP
ncbi:MAG TPA: PucR family transcriptional regulator, partial [Streptomyces sp.]